MSIILPKGKFWQKVEGYVKISSQNNLFRTTPEDWVLKTTLIPFPLDNDEVLEHVFRVFVTYDLNSKAVQKMEVIALKDVKIV